MKRLVGVLFFLFSTCSLSAQFWLEDFGTDPGCGITEADNYVTSNGLWTVQTAGANGIAAHNWHIGAQEAEMELGECGDSCMDDGDLEENTLYISNEAFNAAYGAVFKNGADSETHLRVVSPVVSFLGVSDTMALKLKYIYSGHPNTVCVLEFFDGTTWFDLWEIEETIGACGDAGQWSEEVVVLPPDVLGNPSVQFGFRWENTGPDEMPFPELSFALGELECSCFSAYNAGIDFSNVIDPNTSPNPQVSISYGECSTDLTEVYVLSPWAVDLFGQSNVILGCSAGPNDECVPESATLEYEEEGCNGEAISFVFDPQNSVYGPDIWFDVAYFSFSPDVSSICEGQCVDFSFYPGIFALDGLPTYEITVTGGATIENLDWDWMFESVQGQVCFNSSGSFTLSGEASQCGETLSASEIFNIAPADFEPEITFSDNNICPGGCIEFSIEEIPDAEVEWTFEGGTPSSSNLQQPGEICFGEQGNFNVGVSVSGGAGCGYGEVQEGITVIDCGEPPVAAISASTTTVCVGQCIDFFDESTGTNNDSWNWTFLGGSPGTSNDQNPTGICYDTPGFHPVMFSVSNLAGADNIFDLTMIEVVECPSPVAAISASSTQICLGECIDFTDESTGSNINNWAWTFDGAATENSDEQNPSGICYDTPGTYSVTLLVSNPNGSDEVTEATMVVVDPCIPDPVPNFSVDAQTICPGECVSFTNESTFTGDTEWNWSFSGANTPTSDEESPQDICYSEPGTYNVTLTVTDEGGTESITQNNLINVEECPEPNAMFAVSESVICPGECVQINNLSTGNINGYTWGFPSNIVGDTTAVDPELCFDQPGTYSISLTAFNDDGETSEYTLEQAVIVDPCMPEIAIEVSEERICVGDCVSFTNISEVTTSNWLWTFPGAVNTTSQAENPTQVCYHTPGVFEVTLQADFGAITVDSTFSQIVHVIDSCGPEANFNFTPIVCLGQCYDFENTSTGGSDYFWIFEGAVPLTSEDEHPREICYLEETGLFNIVLTVSDEFGSSTSITQQVSVVNPPAVNAGPDQIIIQGTSTVLSATAGNGSGQYIWQPFEDVTCFSCPTTSTYPLHETTTFVLYYEEPGGCQTSDTLVVAVEESNVFGVPGSFSPNGDGTNDVLYVRGNNITQLDFQVFNRYGEKVFETQSQKIGWDGTKNGRDLNAGVFGYVLEVVQVDGNRQVISGDITLVR